MGTDESFQVRSQRSRGSGGAVQRRAPAAGTGTPSSHVGTQHTLVGSQLLHFVFVLLQLSVHHFESSEEVPKEEQQKRESQHTNLRKGGEEKTNRKG